MVNGTIEEEELFCDADNDEEKDSHHGSVKTDSDVRPLNLFIYLTLGGRIHGGLDPSIKKEVLLAKKFSKC